MLYYIKEKKEEIKMKRKNLFLRFITFGVAFCMSIILCGGCTTMENSSSINGSEESGDTSSVEEVKKLEGKKISILGDSNASLAGVSDSTELNSTMGGNYNFFPRYDIYNKNETWWELVAKQTGTEILVNNSSSGAKASGDRFDNGWQDRCVQLHCDHGERAGEEPDIILVKLINNDFFASVPYGKFNKLSDIWSEESGYITPTTYSQALAIIIHKMLNRYQNADIFVFTLTYRNNCDLERLELYNDCIRLVAEYFEAKTIEWYGYGNFNHDNHTIDGIHYNEEGMKLVAQCVTETLEDFYASK